MTKFINNQVPLQDKHIRKRLKQQNKERFVKKTK